MNNNLEDTKWVMCPVCHNKTRTKIRKDTVLENFPLYCPKCKGEFLISLKNEKIVYINSQTINAEQKIRRPY